MKLNYSVDKMGLENKAYSSEKGIAQLLGDLEREVTNNEGDLKYFVGSPTTVVNCHTFLLQLR